MNRKMKKAAALIASAVLCLSMGVTVLAASPTDPAIPEKENTQAYAYQAFDKDGNKVTLRSEQISQEVEEILKDESAVKDILTGAGYEVSEDDQVVVLGAGDFHTVDKNFEEFDQDISDGVEFTFELGASNEEYGYATENWDDLKDLKNGDTIYVLHQKADGTWEVLEGTAVVEDNYYTTVSVKVTLTSLSPIAFVKVMSNGEVVVLDKNEVPVSQVETSATSVTSSKTTEKVTTTSVTVKKSPKTGE